MKSHNTVFDYFNRLYRWFYHLINRQQKIFMSTDDKITKSKSACAVMAEQ